MPDLMSSVFKTFCSNVILDGVNSFEEMEKNKLKKIDNDLINNKIKGDFNLTYFVQFLYSILSNDSKYKNNNKEKIQNIFNSNKTDKKHLELIEFLKLKVKDIINIIRYKNDDKTGKIEEKLLEFLINQYNNFEIDPEKCKSLKEYIKQLYENKIFVYGKNTNEEIISYIKKDYICSFLLLAYNIERFFYLKISRGFKNYKKLLSIFLIKVIPIKRFYRKLKLFK